MASEDTWNVEIGDRPSDQVTAAAAAAATAAVRTPFHICQEYYRFEEEFESMYAGLPMDDELWRMEMDQEKLKRLKQEKDEAVKLLRKPEELLQLVEAKKKEYVKLYKTVPYPGIGEALELLKQQYNELKQELIYSRLA